MDAVLVALAEQHDELGRLLDGLDDDDLKRPSRCEGWTVADVVTHLVQTDRMALAGLRGHYGETLAELTEGAGFARTIDDGAALMVERERGTPGPQVRERWRVGTEELRAAFCDTDLGARVTWVAGELSARTLATTRLAETWIHTGDVAAAFDRLPAPTDRLWHVARLAWRTLPYAFGRAGRTLHGPVAFHLRGPDGDAWDFVPDADPATVVRGDAVELCLVASRRVEPHDTGLRADGPDASDVLELVRTYA